jgi:UDP-2,4-diacetamido-2,4,6-trideoxy-beta-L-altropyranose hydrolase
VIFMHIVIRADASDEIGTGHVMRCLTLADALARKGARVSFVCLEHDGHLCDLIERRGHAVHRLPPSGEDYSAEDVPAHAAWLGASWQDDAGQTAAIIQSFDRKPDWLVVDHYAIDHRWERTLRPLVNRIFVIDDLADRNHECDILLDQNLVENLHSRYTGLVPEDCTLLLGPRYALLDPIYADLHDRIPPRDGPVRRILISFSGADRDNLTGRALEAFISLDRPDIEVDVVLSDGHPHAASIRQLSADHPNIHLHGTLLTLAPLMARADLAIGAAGSTSWERLCLGLPAIVVTLAENQRLVADNLRREKLIQWIGHKDLVDRQTINEALAQIINTQSIFYWSFRCLRICDGQGVSRVKDLLVRPPKTRNTKC